MHGVKHGAQHHTRDHVAHDVAHADGATIGTLLIGIRRARRGTWDGAVAIAAVAKEHIDARGHLRLGAPAVRLPAALARARGLSASAAVAEVGTLPTAAMTSTTCAARRIGKRHMRPLLGLSH